MHFLFFTLALIGSTFGAELRLGFFPNVTHAQAVLAHQSGEFERAIGCSIKWIPFNAGPSAIEAMFSGAIDATFIGPNPAINGYIKSRGESFCVVAGAASGGAALVVRGDAGIVTEKDFHGKTVATPQLGNTQDVAARAWFLHRGFRFKERGGDLTLLPLANPDQLLMFQKKQIDAAWTVEPWVSRLEVEGGGRVFLEEKTLWPQGRYVTTHLIVSRKFLKENRSVVEKLVEAHVALTARLRENPQGQMTVLNEELKKLTGKALGEEVLKKALSRVEFTWDPLKESLLKSAQEAHAVGFLREQPELSGLYDLSLLNAALKSRGIGGIR